MGFMSKKAVMLYLKIAKNRLLVYLKNYLEWEGNNAIPCLLGVVSRSEEYKEASLRSFHRE
ncbi:hypothetical protein NSTC731_02222 [Nostoc sp. DSM 114167]|jgi:hypothetical protein